MKPARTAYSLLEVIAASALVAAALVPALAILRDGMAWSRDVDTRQLLANYSVFKLEELQALTANNWSNGTDTGDYAADGHANVRFIAVRSDAVVDGGSPDQLMSITVTTYWDANGDDALTAGEAQVVMTTKLGRFGTYEAI